MKYKPLTHTTWNDFVQLFGANGACGGCWCMYWRLKAGQFNRQKGDGNKVAMKELMESGYSPGILLYDDANPIGWCSVSPREDFLYFETTRTLKPIDHQPVWSISCFFIRKEYRRKGFSKKLINNAIDFVAKQGGKVVEAYPSIPKKERMPDAFAWTGIGVAFEKCGFIVVAKRGARNIVRFEIQGERC